ncbi:MAG: HTTM domain-containing protein [Planctomycetes bacterium]|nr:HTTM domain-containing protein [Planctomycetota bacterium]
MNRFFFAPESPRLLAIVRIAAGAALLYDAARHWPHAVELYSRAGLPMPAFPDAGPVPPIPSMTMANVAQTLLLYVLAATMIGWWTRTSAALSFVLLGWLSLLDLPATLTKSTMIGLHALLLMSVSGAGRAWSLDSALDPQRRRRTLLAAAWPRRLMQVLVCSIYWGAAVTKIRLADFATGDLLEFSLLSDAWGGTRFGLWLSTQRPLVVAVSIATVWFELFFPVLIWFRRTRRWALAAAVVFHVALAATMRLGIFPYIMLAALAAFLEQRDLDQLRRLTLVPPLKGGPGGVARDDRQFSGSTPPHPPLVRGGTAVWTSASAYVACAIAAAFAAISLAPEAPMAATLEWPELHAPDVDVVLAEQKLNHADYLHRLELGSRLGYRQVFGPSERFAAGAVVYALARFALNDEPLDLDWILLAPDGREVARHSLRLSPALSYASVPFAIPADAPLGGYQLILQIAGVEAARRPFVLTATDD